MSRTIATALPVWLAVTAAVITVAVTVSSTNWGAILPVIAAGAVLMTFVINVSLQSKDGLVNRMLVSVTGSVLILAAASAATLVVNLALSPAS